MSEPMPGPRPEHCPRCDSPAPNRHPAVQAGGEVQPCPDDWHYTDPRYPNEKWPEYMGARPQ